MRKSIDLIKKDDFGHWKCEISAAIQPFSAFKVDVQLATGQHEDRIPAWVNFTRQNQDHSFDGVYVELNDYKWQHPKPTWSG